MKILVINCGSSSIKYQLFEIKNNDFVLLAKGLVDRIGESGSGINHKPANADSIAIKYDLADHKAAMELIVSTLTHPEHGVISDLSEINGVGHRVVHGGEEFSSSVLITEDVIKGIVDRYDLAPLHNPPNVTGIQACKALGDIPNVAVFDTAIHQTIPPKAYMYAIPLEFYKKYGIRKYGFHGTSHGYVSKKAAELLGKPFEELKIITCHVGNGGSIAAFADGKCQDTSMGMTPLEGIVMGTRCGDLDPAVVLYMMRALKMTADEIDNLLNKKSGMLGLTGYSDMRDVNRLAEAGDENAQTALDMFCYQIQKYIGAYVSTINGVDAIVFTAGVGENDQLVRAKVLENFSYLGLKIDHDRNDKNETILSTDDSKVTAMMIPTNEELVIAQEAYSIIHG
ncbi:MAG: acetate kinase [Phycisphaerae bacterium]|nr:acetate kinase [Phycisphaerae bacterium]